MARARRTSRPTVRDERREQRQRRAARPMSTAWESKQHAVARDVVRPRVRRRASAQTERAQQVVLVHELQPRVEAEHRGDERAARSRRTAGSRSPGPTKLAKRSVVTATSGRRRENPRT